MGSLDAWGAIAAAVLLVQCIVFNLVFVALALGLWKGTEWVHSHTAGGVRKVGGWLRKGQSATVTGQRALAAPLVRLRAGSTGLRAAWLRLKGS